MVDIHKPEKDQIEPETPPAEIGEMDAKLAEAEAAEKGSASEQLVFGDQAELKNQVGERQYGDSIEADSRIGDASEASKVVDNAIGGDEVKGKTGESTIWSEGAVERGRKYEVLKDANIAGNYPVIDDFSPETGVATSYKTIDLNSESYHDTNRLESTLTAYTDKLSEFQGRTWHQDGKAIEIAGEDIQEKVMCVGIPMNSMTIEQQETLLQSKDYAAKKGVKLVFEAIA